MWEPPLSPKQRDLYLTTKRLVLAVGPRACGKTWALEHIVLRHAWRTNPSRFAIICKTTRAGSLGVWPELTTVIFDEWVKAGICTEDSDFGWTVTPRTDPTTKIRHAKLRNRYGGESELLLFPVERAADAMDKLLSTQFSGIWISEAHLYESRELFDVARNQLRLAGVPFKDTRLLCDCNPPDEGTEHWLYDVFYRERLLEPDRFPTDWDEETAKAFVEHQKSMEVFEFSLADNTFLDPGLANQIRATYARDPEAFARLVRGEWLNRSNPRSVFVGCWDANKHVFGNASSPDEGDWEVLAPSNGLHAFRAGAAVEVLAGWDLGDTNHAWAALQPWEDSQGRICFDILDEVLHLREKITVEEMTLEVMEHMRMLEGLAGFPVEWIHYSDSSAMLFRSSARKTNTLSSEDDLTDAGLVLSASRGEIELVGAAAVKKVNWQRRRVLLLQQLLSENRIRVSAHCKGIIEMFQKLRKDTSEKASTYLAPGQDVKHLFDAVSYPVSMRLLGHLEDSYAPKTASKPVMVSSR